VTTRTERERRDAGRRTQREKAVERVYGVSPLALMALETFQTFAAYHPFEDPRTIFELYLAGAEAELAEADRGNPPRCWGCRRANGQARNLAMDHNHRTGEARMLLCSHCNRFVVGHFRDDPVALIRLGLALINPPSREAWALPGQLPGWHTEGNDDLAEWLAEWSFDEG
jgi:hypothetical protein